MRNPFKPKTHETTIQELIDTAYTQLFPMTPGTKEYDEMLDHIERLNKIGTQKGFWSKISPDAIVAALASLGGILIIINAERLQIMTSKAVGFVMKTKI